jgi:hypothetical protein
MGIFFEGRIDVGMASLARLGPHIAFLTHLPFFLTEGGETDKQHQRDDSDQQDHPSLASTHIGSPLATESGPFLASPSAWQEIGSTLRSPEFVYSNSKRIGCQDFFSRSCVFPGI